MKDVRESSYRIQQKLRAGPENDIKKNIPDYNPENISVHVSPCHVATKHVKILSWMHLSTIR